MYGLIKMHHNVPQHRVGKGNLTSLIFDSPQASHRTVLDSLPSHGSSNRSYNIKLILVKVGKLHFLLANPFAPFPLQELPHYYGLVCPCMMLRYFASRVNLLCIWLRRFTLRSNSLCFSKQVLKFRNQARIKFLPSVGRLPFSQ